jgi:hypothetical protein
MSENLYTLGQKPIAWEDMKEEKEPIHLDMKKYEYFLAHTWTDLQGEKFSEHELGSCYASFNEDEFNKKWEKREKKWKHQQAECTKYMQAFLEDRKRDVDQWYNPNGAFPTQFTTPAVFSCKNDMKVECSEETPDTDQRSFDFEPNACLSISFQTNQDGVD